MNGNAINTSIDKEFLNNFSLIYNSTHDKNVLKFYCPQVDANSFCYENIIDSLREAAAHYCLSKRTWEEVKNRPMKLSHMVREKFRNIDANEGELGELLLFSFLESDLNAPKILTKMELKTNPNMYINGADAVHFLKLSDGNYQLIFGESKAYKTLKGGIDAALDSIYCFKNNTIKGNNPARSYGITYERGLLCSYITNETYNEDEALFLKSIIYPKEENRFEVDTAFAVFVLFNFTILKKYKVMSNSDFRKWLHNNLQNSIKSIEPNIIKKIESKGLNGHHFYFYLLPIDKLDANRKILLEKVIE